MNNKLGYTLIEVLVAVVIFFIIVGSPTGFFIISLRSQARNLSLREAIDASSYALEYMGRALRMAKKEVNPPTCLSLYGLNYELTSNRNLGGINYSGIGIKFINYHGECQEFFLDETTGHDTKGQLMETKNESAPVALTPSGLEINFLKFKISGEGQEDDSQPRITILFEITKKGQTNFPKTRIQTTISQRNLDVIY